MIKWGKRGEIDELAAIVLAFILGVIVLIIGATVSEVSRSLTSQQSRLVEAEGAILSLTPRDHCLGQTLWDPKLGSVRCSPKQPTNNTNGAIVGTLLSLTSGRARGIPIHFVSAVKELPPGDQARRNSLLRRGGKPTIDGIGTKRGWCYSLPSPQFTLEFGANIMRHGLRASVFERRPGYQRRNEHDKGNSLMRADAIEQMKLSLIGTLQNLKYGQHHYVGTYPDTSSWNSGFESHRGLQSGSRGTENERMLLSHKSGTSIPRVSSCPSRPTLMAA